MEALDTTYNGASIDASEAIESVQPPHVIWRAWKGTVTTSRDGGPIQTLRCYKLTAYKIGGGAICGPMDGSTVATVIFAADGGRVSRDAIERMERDAERYQQTGWREDCNAVNVVRDLLQALAHRPEGA